ncbi:hypothetical protein HNQ51_000079 [Inhella inkyongensis]|uniref:Glycosyltransferase 2-like domain-containing protein n=1 Tax=Inhella inkyongensis TaxID=392593 RepID=A0A840S135_9BURK|nr:hypothetical protein [Inhella inkyongensis]
MLDIFLITFNRSKLLERTLRVLLDSPLGHLKIVVLDNCSEDDTVARVQELQKVHSNLVLVRNRVNIGASANAISAFLQAQNRYCWVLCDDDELRLEGMAAFLSWLNCLTIDGPDLILVGGHQREKAPFDGTAGSAHDLILQGCNFFRDGSFLPGIIYKVEFALRVIPKCYEFSAWMYPHVALLLEAYSRNSSVQVSPSPLVIARLGLQSYSQAQHLDCWIALTKRIQGRSLRRQFLSCQWVDRWDRSGVRGLLGSLIYNRRLRYIPLLFWNYPMLTILAFPRLFLKFVRRV